MTSQQLDEERIFHIAREISSEAARREYLEQICAGDAALHERVEALLKVHDDEQSFLKSDGALAPTVDLGKPLEKVGVTIGRYKLMEQLGEGGMGTVFVAQQERPIRRKVALKLIKPGMDSKSVVARFEAERQALAMMDHPNIAKVLDAGTTESGRPYFAMELVKGVLITEYCDRNRLTIPERLELFIQVCQAIQHAHQKGIIHRDIKPSNVLVTLHDGQPVPKVIDFGVAKALNARLTDKTIYTEHLQVVGTLLYMSPEQAELSGLDVDTRSDIYSLGVLLYELLTGTTPFRKAQLDQAGFDEQRRIICDQEPQRASARISNLGETATAVAEQRQTDARKLQEAVQGELDCVVLMSLDKDRTRRYESAGAFAEDLMRFLNGDPVNAHPPSLGYRFRKYVRRNRGLVAATTLILVSLVLGLSASLYGMGKAMTLAKDLKEQLEQTRRAELGQAAAEGRLVQTITSKIQNLVLSGRFIEAQARLVDGETLGVDQTTRKILAAQVHLFEGNYEKAIQVLEDARRTADEKHLLTIDSILAIAFQRNGQELKHFEYLDRVLDEKCHSFSDYLFRGYALFIFFPDRALKDLEIARRMDPTSHMAMLCYAQALGSQGSLRLDARTGLGELERSMKLLSAIRFYLPNNDTIPADLAASNVEASSRCMELGYSDKAERLKQEARRQYALMDEQSADGLQNRAACQFIWGWESEILEDYRRSKSEGAVHNQQALWTAVLHFKNGEYDKADETLHATEQSFRDSMAYARALFRLEQVKSPEELRSLFATMTEKRVNSPGIFAVFDWVVYRLCGDKASARTSAARVREFAERVRKPGWVAWARFMAEEEYSADELLAACKDRVELTYAHFLIAFDALASGDRASAKNHFQAALDTNSFQLHGYLWSKVLLERLNEDSRWLPWIESPLSRDDSDQRSDAARRRVDRALSAQFTVQIRPRKCPAALGGGGRDSQQIGGVLERNSGEVSQFQ